MRVVIGMSGGVDSSVAAYLLKKSGFEVYGVLIELGETSCCSIPNAERVAVKLEIPLIRVNREKEFKKKIINYFIKEYRKGRTPNPCALCNRDIKFKTLMQYAKDIGADKMATGHYAEIEKGFLKPGRDREKSQEYFLCLIEKKHLKNILFPLADKTKKEVLQIAKKEGLLDQRRESQDVCFLKEERTPSFLEKTFGVKEGEIRTEDGRVLGTHKGYYRFTIGQRKGIGVAFPKPLYVKKIIPKENTVIVSTDVSFKKMVVETPNFFKNIKDEKTKVKIRYKHKPAPAWVKRRGNLLYVEFLSPQKAVTPGQIACFYDEDEKVIAGGIIKKGL